LGADGHIQLRVELHCADERTASERAKQLADDHDVELWEGARLIRTRIQRMHIGVIRAAAWRPVRPDAIGRGARCPVGRATPYADSPFT